MAEPIRIANCSGFYGDRLSAASEMVSGGPIDVLTGDWLAELTMLILSRVRAKRPGGGFATTFVTQMEQVMGDCLDRGIKVISNAGGLDPASCAEAVAEVADRLGLSPTIAFIDGDDLAPQVGELIDSGALRRFDDGNPHGSELAEAAEYLTANAYFGCWGIVDALSRGADIVITGRVTDASLVCGPAAWHHGWRRDDLDQLAGAVVAGHLIECSGQVTGGNYSFFREVPGLERVGFPWAEVASDGSAVIGKHDGTGGLVSVGTVTSQLLYEIGGPRYIGPDVTTRLDTVELEPIGPDRIRVTGARGESPPPDLKVAMNRLGGYRNQITIALTGLDIEAKATAVEAAFFEHCPYERSDFEQVVVQLVRNDVADPATNEEATASLHITVKDPDAAKVGRAFTNAFIELALSNIPGFYASSGAPGGAGPFGVYQPALVPARLVSQRVHVGTSVVDIESRYSGAEVSYPCPSRAGSSIADSDAELTPELIEVTLGELIGTRSGDKGGNANLGVFVRDSRRYGWLLSFLTVERLRALLPEVADLPVERYEFPKLAAVNFTIYGLLEEGVAAASRADGQAKSLGEWLRSRRVVVPIDVADTTEASTGPAK